MCLRALGCAAALLLSLASPIAGAQLFRAYLDPSGSDANPCTIVAPCRLLPAALAAVTDGGEVWMLDSANYNTGIVNVTKSVTILAIPGALGSVVSTGGGPAISIETAGVKVALRNLVIVPIPGGGATYGVYMTAGDALTVESCLIANLQTGIIVFNAANVSVADTTIRGNGVNGMQLSGGATTVITRAIVSGNASGGIIVLGTDAGTTTRLDIGDSTLDRNSTGVLANSSSATGVVKVSVRDSRIVANSYGLYAQSLAGAAVTLSAGNNVVSNNAIAGITAQGLGAKAWASANTVSENGTGLAQNVSAVFESAGNNAVRNNGGDKSGTITVVVME